MPSKLVSVLNDQRRTGHLCDVVIQLPNGSREWAHFCVLAAQCNLVRHQYVGPAAMQFSMHQPLTIEVHQFDCAQCLEKAIDYIYADGDGSETGAGIADANTDEHGPSAQQIELLLSSIESLMEKGAPSVMEDTMSIAELHETDSTLIVRANDVDTIPEIIKPKTRPYQYRVQALPSLSKMHTCLGCDHKCYRPAEMVFHLQVCHTKNTTCNLCDTPFDTLTEFKGHLIRHDHPKPFFCVDCDQRFTTKTALNLHTPKHSQTPSHTCPDCGKRFKWKHGLHNHMIVHANEKRLLCDECGYSTSHLKTLRVHQLSHTGTVIRCPSSGCSYTSRRKENLKTHMATHRNETPFVCEVCGHRFSQNKNLRRHALLHVAKNLHKCPHCEFTSYRTDKLKEHMVRQHTEKPLQLELDECVPSALDDRDVSDVVVVKRPPAQRKSALVRAKAKPAFILPKGDVNTSSLGKVVPCDFLKISQIVPIATASQDVSKPQMSVPHMANNRCVKTSGHPVFILPKEVVTSTLDNFAIDIDSSILINI